MLAQDKLLDIKKPSPIGPSVVEASGRTGVVKVFGKNYDRSYFKINKNLLLILSATLEYSIIFICACVTMFNK